MGISCQRNGHWATTNHLSGRGLVQPLLFAVGPCAGRDGALIRQLANSWLFLVCSSTREVWFGMNLCSLDVQ